MKIIVSKAKKIFQTKIKKNGYDPYGLINHVEEVEKWANFLCAKYDKADKEIVMLGVWLHDLGHYPLPCKIDHAFRSEELSRKFLKKENYPFLKIEKALHCIRAHRCKDVMPETLEAKIVACADSASHFTDYLYMDMAKNDKNLNKEFSAYAKIERDYRDLSFFPEIKKKLTPIYQAWKKLIKEYEKI